MKFLVCLVLGFLSWTSSKASCPERYEAVSYLVGPARKESCYFLSTGYIRWKDGANFCARNHNGYLAEFVSLPEWEAFKTFISNIANQTKDELWDGQHIWIGGCIFDRSVWRWNSSGEVLNPLLSNGFAKDDLYGLTINVHSKEMVPQKLASLVCPGHPTIHSYVCESDERVEGETENHDSKTLAGNSSECQAELEKSRQEVQQLQDETMTLASSLERTEKRFRERDQMLSSFVRELEKATTELLETTGAAASLVEQSQSAKAKEQADFLIPNMHFTIKKSDYQRGEAKSNVVKAGGLRWRVSFWFAGFAPRFLIHAEKEREASSTWSLTAQALTLKVLKKGAEGGLPVTHLLEGATFSSDMGVVGMITLDWGHLSNPSKGFVDAEGTLHVEISIKEASMSTSPPSQRPTVWEAEATLKLRDLTSTLSDWGDMIFSSPVHVGGVDWRVGVGRRDDSYLFQLLCNLEERDEWTLSADWTMTVLSTKAGEKNAEEEVDGSEVNRGDPWTSLLLSIKQAAIGNYLTGDSVRVVVKIRGHRY